MITVLYRYSDSPGGGTFGPLIQLEHFDVLRETPQGYWFIDPYMRAFGGDYQEEHKRWVSKTARRRYCYPTREEAWESYKIRKRRQRGHLRRQLEDVEEILKVLDQPPPEREFFTRSGRVSPQPAIFSDPLDLDDLEGGP